MEMITNTREFKWKELYDFTGRTAVITGGTGVLGGEIACGLAACGANVVILGRNLRAGEKIRARMGSCAANCELIACDVLDVEAIRAAAAKVQQRFGRVHILINAAGGNNPKATTRADQKFFDLPADALRWVFDLNLMGTILPSQVFGKMMAEEGSGA
ncbi:MAG: SDR family NAD(P)-dependent oxidoreductase, partial [Terriglobales bacterium]